jgi:hypothetical protein
MTRLEIIDTLIEQHHLLGRRCLHPRRRNRCECGHIDDIHVLLGRAPDGFKVHGACQGRHKGRRCPCVVFSPYTYRKEDQAKLKKLRMFALDLMDAAAKEERTRLITEKRRRTRTR